MEETSWHIWVMDELGSVCCRQRQAAVVSPKRGVLHSLCNCKLQNLANTVQTHSEMSESDEQRNFHTAPLSATFYTNNQQIEAPNDHQLHLHPKGSLRLTCVSPVCL